MHKYLVAIIMATSFFLSYPAHAADVPKQAPTIRELQLEYQLLQSQILNYQAAIRANAERAAAIKKELAARQTTGGVKKGKKEVKP